MKHIFVALLLLLSNVLLSQYMAKFIVHSDKIDLFDVPVFIILDTINYNVDNGKLALYEIVNDGEIMITSQIEQGHSLKLWFVLREKTSKNRKREFIIKYVEKQVDSLRIVLESNENSTLLKYNDQPILNYHHAEKFPPEDVDIKFKRSAFIHPLFSPDGEILTRIQSPDHYHHYGIWNPWAKTHIDGKEVDFWNLNKEQGTVKFVEYLSTIEGSVFSGFKVLQEHVFFHDNKDEEIAMNEVWDVRAWNVGDGDYWLVDFVSTLNSPLENGIILDAYRYGGGIGFRATETWHKDNCTVLTSEGKIRTEADGTNAKWCIVEGVSKSAEGRSGILFLSYPENRMHPEPMRIWPLDANSGRGDMFFEFCPIRHNEWKIEPKKNYTLKYRMIIFDGEMSPELAELYWNSFAFLPEIEFIK